MKIIDIAIKDMTQYFRSLMALVMMFVVPVLLVGMFYVMFGGDDPESESFYIPITEVIIVNQDNGNIRYDAAIPSAPTESGWLNSPFTMGNILTDLLQSEAFVNMMSITVIENVEDAKKLVDRQEAGIAIMIPSNFSESFSNLNEKAYIEFYQDPGLRIGPSVVKGVLNQLLDSIYSSEIALKTTFEQLGKDGITLDDITSQAVIETYIQEYITQQQNHHQEELLRIQNLAGEEFETFSSSDIIGMMMTGMTVFYVFFAGTSTAQSLLTEKLKGTLPRLFTTPTHQSTILAGKFLTGVFTIAVQITVLMLFGWLIFQIKWGRLLTLLPIVITITLAAASFGIFLLSFAHTERQAGLMIGGFVTIMGMLGMLPVFVFSMQKPPQVIFTVSHLVPQGWAVEALKIAMDGGSPSDVFINSIVLLGWAALFFMIGTIRFKKRFA